MKFRKLFVLSLSGVAMVPACSGEPVDVAQSVPQPLTFEEFEAQAYRNPETGEYVVDGDIGVSTLAELREQYDRYLASTGMLRADTPSAVGTSREPLIAAQTAGADNDWSESERLALTYCISQPEFDGSGAGRYNQVVNAMATATAGWEAATKVRFTHVATLDNACTSATATVNFNVHLVSGSGFVAEAFRPDEARASRVLNIDTSAFSLSAPITLAGVLRHELGHTIGFRHEHTRPESGTCFEDNTWRVLTNYDAASVMHYPQCNGSNSGDLVLTARDTEGVRRLYYQPGAYFADFTGDARADAVVLTGSSVINRRSNGASFNANETWSTVAYFGELGSYMADVTGDGRADAIVVNQGGITVRRSNGSSFNANEAWTTNAYYGTRGTYFADVTGDGRADAIVINDSGPVVVRRSNGSSFNANENWLTSTAFGNVGTYFADVTGDARADMILISTANVTVRRSDGSSFGASQTWSTVPYFGTRDNFFADVTGDGRADAIVVNDGGVTVRRSNGSSFNANEAWTTTGYFGNRGTHFADVTGDALADAIVVNDGGVTVRRSNGSAFGGNEAWTTSGYFGIE